ncbi:MAG: GNAT family N-acetyltransferase [Clostridia bacterium]|nr:GNAT family N-acetyltransferase [Clostridia bacterium]
MIIKEIDFKLKDGRKALIRCPKDEDIPGMLDYLRISAGETEFLLRYPEECGKYTAEGERTLFRRVNSSANEAMLVCLVDGVIAGNCQISWSEGLKTRHRASVAVAVLREYWGLGIGARLFQELINIAEKNERILQIELDFIEGNNRARAMYEKLGFRITGVKPDAIRLKDGTLLNEYSMIKKINH